jgi:hypothetical protein
MPSGTASNIESVSPEKELTMHVEHSAHGLSPGDEEFLANFSHEEKKRVLRKVCAGTLCLFAYMTQVRLMVNVQVDVWVHLK